MTIRVLTKDLHNHPKGHNQQGNQEVSDCQRHQEVIGHILKPFLPADSQADQKVAHSCAGNDQRQTQHPPLQRSALGLICRSCVAEVLRPGGHVATVALSAKNVAVASGETAVVMDGRGQDDEEICHRRD